MRGDYPREVHVLAASVREAWFGGALASSDASAWTTTLLTFHGTLPPLLHRHLCSAVAARAASPRTRSGSAADAGTSHGLLRSWSAHQHAVVSTDRYCSRECQRSSWSVHRLTCESMAEVGVQALECVLRKKGLLCPGAPKVDFEGFERRQGQLGEKAINLAREIGEDSELGNLREGQMFIEQMTRISH